METPGNNITGYQDLAIAENRQMREDDIKRSKGKFDYLAETRDWSSAVTEERCKRLARSKGKRLVEIIDTEDEPLPIICIFEDYQDD